MAEITIGPAVITPLKEPIADYSSINVVVDLPAEGLDFPYGVKGDGVTQSYTALIDRLDARAHAEQGLRGGKTKARLSHGHLLAEKITIGRRFGLLP